MTQNSLNGAKFYELRRSPQKIRDSFEIKPSGNFSPTVICDSDQIGILLNENFADIRIFATDHSENPECVRRFSLESDPQFVTRIDGPCGVRRVYKGVPSSSVTYSLRLIVSHNPSEITEYDKIYDVMCSMHLKTMEVKADYDIISPKIAEVASSPSKIRGGPKCKYSLHHDRVGGPKTFSAHVGEVIYHRWKCASLGSDPSKFIFKVYACFVNDQFNRTYSIIDDNGCSLDEEIIPTPEYDVQNGIIYTPSKAFRFANSNHVHFKCMISVCSTADPSCRNSVPPKCKGRKQRREVKMEEMTIEQRLLRIRELMRSNGTTTTKVVENGKRRKTVLEEGSGRIQVETDSMDVQGERDYELQKLQTVLQSYRIWTWIVCCLNVILVILCLIVTFRLLKNKYRMDIKDKSDAVFRRVPF